MFVHSLLRIVGMLFLASAMIGMVAAWSLLERQPWARTLAIVVAFTCWTYRSGPSSAFTRYGCSCRPSPRKSTSKSRETRRVASWGCPFTHVGRGRVPSFDGNDGDIQGHGGYRPPRQGLGPTADASNAARIAPIADKHKLMVGYHGHDQTTDPNQTATLESYDTLMIYGGYRRPQ